MGLAGRENKEEEESRFEEEWQKKEERLKDMPGERSQAATSQKDTGNNESKLYKKERKGKSPKATDR